MEDGIAIRYYRVGRADQTHQRLGDRLKAILALGGPGKRQRVIGGIQVRLETLETPSSGIFEGEFVRLQERDYPSEVNDNSVVPLSTNNPLGHHVAFCYNEQKSVIALQFDVRALSVSRINGYLGQFSPHNEYLFNPLLRKDAWERFAASPPRKITFQIASPKDLASIDGSNMAVYEQLGALGKNYSPHLLELTMSMGQKAGTLKKAGTLVKDLLKRDGNGTIDLRKLKAKVEGQADEINLIEELLDERITLELPKNDPTASYELRIKALREGMKRHAKSN